MIETFDIGKPYAAAMRLDINETTERLRYFAGWCTKLAGATLSGQGPDNWHGYTLRELHRQTVHRSIRESSKYRSS